MNSKLKRNFKTLVIALTTISIVLASSITFGFYAKSEDKALNSNPANANTSIFEIANQDDFTNFATQLSSDPKVNAKLTNDITLTDRSTLLEFNLKEGWTLDGDGRTITVQGFTGASNNVLGIDANNNPIVENVYGGLFGINQGTVKNLTLLVTATNSSNPVIGGIAGVNNGYGKIENVTVNINNSGFTGTTVGGLVGKNNGTISGCNVNFNNTINQSSVIDFGGIAGQNTGSIIRTNVGVTAAINVTQGNFGGVVGKNTAAAKVYFTTVKADNAPANFSGNSGYGVGLNESDTGINGIYVDTKNANYQVIGKGDASNIYILTQTFKSSIKITGDNAKPIIAKQIVSTEYVDVAFKFTSSEFSTNVPFTISAKLNLKAGQDNMTLYGAQAIWNDEKDQTFNNRTPEQIARGERFNVTVDSKSFTDNNVAFTHSITDDATNQYNYQILVAKVAELNTVTLNSNYEYNDNLMETYRAGLSVKNNAFTLHKDDLSFFGEKNGNLGIMNTPGTYSSIVLSNSKYTYNNNVLDCTTFEDIYNQKDISNNPDITVVFKSDTYVNHSVVISAVTFDGAVMDSFAKNYEFKLSNNTGLNQYRLTFTNGDVRTITRAKYPSLFTNNGIIFNTDTLDIPSTVNGVTRISAVAINSDGTTISDMVSIVLMIDKDAPEIQLADNYNSNWYKVEQGIMFSVFDRQMDSDFTVKYGFATTMDDALNLSDNQLNEVTANTNNKYQFTLTNGDYWYLIMVQDQLGNTRKYTYNFKMDTTIPTFNITNNSISGTKLDLNNVPANTVARIRFDSMKAESLDTVNKASYIEFVSGSVTTRLVIDKLTTSADGNFAYYEFKFPFYGQGAMEIVIVTRSGNVSAAYKKDINVTKDQILISISDFTYNSKQLTKSYDGTADFVAYDGNEYSGAGNIKWKNDAYKTISFKFTFENAKLVGKSQKLILTVEDDRYDVLGKVSISGAMITTTELVLVTTETNYQIAYSGKQVDISGLQYYVATTEKPGVPLPNMKTLVAGSVNLVLTNPQITNAGEMSNLKFSININTFKNDETFDNGEYLIKFTGMNNSEVSGTKELDPFNTPTVTVVKKDVYVTVQNIDGNLTYSGEKKNIEFVYSGITDEEKMNIAVYYQNTTTQDSSQDLINAGSYSIKFLSSTGSILANYNFISATDSVKIAQKKIAAKINDVGSSTNASALEIEYTGDMAKLFVDFGVSTTLLDKDFENGKGISIKLAEESANLFNRAMYDVTTNKFMLDFTNSITKPIAVNEYIITVTITGTANVIGMTSRNVVKIIKTTPNSLEFSLVNNNGEIVSNSLSCVFNNAAVLLNISSYPKGIEKVAYFTKQYWDNNNEYTFEGNKVSVDGNPEILFVIIDWKDANANEEFPYKHTSAGKYEYKINVYNKNFNENASARTLKLEINKTNASDLYTDIKDIDNAQYEHNGINSFSLAKPTFGIEADNNNVKININSVYYWNSVTAMKLKTDSNDVIQKMRDNPDKDGVFTEVTPTTTFNSKDGNVTFDTDFNNAGTYVYRYRVTGSSIDKGDVGVYFIRVMVVNRAKIVEGNLTVKNITKTYDGFRADMDDIKGDIVNWGNYSNAAGKQVMPSYMSDDEEIIDADSETGYDVIYTFSSLNYEDETVMAKFFVNPKPVEVSIKRMERELRIQNGLVASKIDDKLGFIAVFDDPTLPVDENGEKEAVEVSLNCDSVTVSTPGQYQVTLSLDNDNYVATNEPITITLLKPISIINIILVIAIIAVVFLVGGIGIKLYMKKNQIKL